MKGFEAYFKASIGDRVRHKLTGFSGAVTMAAVNEQGDRQFYVEDSEGRAAWIGEKNAEDVQ